MNTIHHLSSTLNSLSFDLWFQQLLEQPANIWDELNFNYVFRQSLHQRAKALVQKAYKDDSQKAMAARNTLHSALDTLYAKDFSIPGEEGIEKDIQPIVRDLTSLFEKAMLAHEYSQLDERIVTDYPQEGKEYVRWLKQLISNHTSSIHPLYNEYLKNEANADELAYYLAQESTLDPRFDDILALMQVGTRGEEKMEIASNYWDEMGNGNHDDVHTKLFARALTDLNVSESYIQEHMLHEARVCGNLSAALALSRRHYFKAVGYFGVTEYLAPRRFNHVVKAWRRNELPNAGIVYHDLHIRIDSVHAKAWLNNVIAPIVDRNPAFGREIAVGVMMRLNSSERYLDTLLDIFNSGNVPERREYSQAS
jgi:hypothetical protein